MEQLKKAMNESATVRWAMLLIMSIAMFANYYFYDALSPLKETLQTELKWSNANYGFFVGAYSMPNVFLFMAVLGGIILDKLGVRITGFMFVVFMVVGSALTAYGASEYFNQGGIGYHAFDFVLKKFSPSLKMMSLGFFIFGLGAETSIVVLTKAIVKWFKGKELALALSVNLALGRLGMFAALWISPVLENHDRGWQVSIWFGTFLLLIGLVTFVVYMFYDVKIDRQLKGSTEEEEEEPFRLRDLGKLIQNPSFIYITLLCVTFYSAVFPFVKFAPDLLANKFGMEVSKASKIVSMLPMGTIIFTPIFGFIADFKGKSASLMIYGSFLLIVVHLMFSLTEINALIPMLLLGVAFSLIPATMWPSVAKIVPEQRLGSAYGLMFSIQNIGLFLFPILIGTVLDISNPGVTIEALKAGTAAYDYTNPILMLAGLGVLGTVFALLLKKADKTSGYGLELPNKQSPSK